jgi:hypothetical protein
MNGLNPMYVGVTTAQHQEDLRRASEYRQVRDARQRTGERNVIVRFFNRLTETRSVAHDRTVECNPRVSC